MSTNTVIVLAQGHQTREHCRQALAGSDCEVLAAATLQQAVQFLEDRAPGVAIVELCEGIEWRSLAQRAGGPRVILYAAGGSMRDAVLAIRQGAVDFLTERDDAKALLASVRRHGGAGDAAGLVCEDKLTREMMELALRVAERPVTVLLSGESGTGKEVFARFIHASSPRSQGPFVALNCAAIPEQMLEAVLFGYEKGAFTGAHRTHAGKFEQAQGGTLLLDEVSEIDPGLQAKLLRVLQEREVERLCGSGPMPVDVRVIATTNRDLRAEVAAGRFREDLFYRLHVFPLALPALRQRPDDIVPLAEAFIRRHCMDPLTPSHLSAAARKALRAHPWPGNVRELENVIQRALVLTDDALLDLQHLRFDPVPRELQPVTETTPGPAQIHTTDNNPEGAPASPASPASDVASLDARMRNREQRLIIDTLEQMNGSRNDTARQLGISVRTLRYKLQRMREQGLNIPGTAGVGYA